AYLPVPEEPLALLGLATLDRQYELVQPHDVACRLEALCAETLPHQRERSIALRRAHLVERYAVAHEVRMDVAPASPRVALQGEVRALSLWLAQGIDEGARGIGDLPGGSSRLLDLEEPGSYPAGGGDSLERLGDERFAGLDVFLKLRGQLLLSSARGHRGALANPEAGRRVRRRARHRGSAYAAAGAERGPHGRQHLAGDPSHEAPLEIVRRRRVRDRVQAHVVERCGRRPEHGEQLLDDLGRPAAQAERVGGGIGQEIDDLAAR